jgi:hypothetical protein
MNSQSLTQLSLTSAETGMRLLQIVMQIIILGTLVLFATTLVIIVWLCLRELRRTQPRSPSLQMAKNENAVSAVPADPPASNSEIYPSARAFSPWYATWARRVFFRSRGEHEMNF